MSTSAFISRVGRKSYYLCSTACSTKSSSLPERSRHELIEIEKSFTDGKTAFKGKSYKDLLRSYLVLRLCCFDTFANNAYKIFTGVHGVVGTRLFEVLFKPTVYANFIAGDSKADILWTAKRLSKSGLMPLISPMLEDSPDAKGFHREMYARNKEVIRESIEICSMVENANGPKCLAIKLTALIPAQIMADLTEKLGPEQNISTENISQLSEAFQAGDLEIVTSLQLNQEEKERIVGAIPILMWLGEECLNKNVSVYIDAEFTQFQPGVRLLALTLINIFNRKHQTIWNTYQCYLRATEDQVKEDTELMDALGAKWAGKIVRGAYMQYERNRAKELGTSDPVHATYTDTSSAYNRTIEYLMEGKNRGKSWRFIIASHNQESILKACSLFKEFNVQDDVYFGQIAGMGEGISCGLAQSGFNVFKLVPTGSVEEVLPWLSRRMEENKGMMAGAERDRVIIFQEIKRRTIRK